MGMAVVNSIMHIHDVVTRYIQQLPIPPCLKAWVRGCLSAYFRIHTYTDVQYK